MQWTKPLAALLGKVSDRALADKAGMHPESVAAERRRRGIEPFQVKSPPIRWTRRRIALLGTGSDSTVAALFDLPRHCVKSKRQALAIPPYYPPPPGTPLGHAWTEEELALLGKDSDRNVAELLGLTPSVVARKRRVLGIAPSVPLAPRIRWTEEMVAHLGRMTDRAFAERFGISLPRVKAKRVELGVRAHIEKRGLRRTAALRKLLRLPPSMARRATGLKYETIAELRAELGIPAPTLGQWRWPAALIRRLGTAPDRALAEELGLSPARVGAKRRQLGIPASRAWRAWTPQETALLGKLPDEVVAFRLNRPISTVTKKRREIQRLARPAPAPRRRDRSRSGEHGRRR